MKLEQLEEQLQCYDSQGQPTECRARGEVKQQPPRWWHAVASIWVVNDQGQIMCSKRSEQLSNSPGKWQTYFGGHVGAGQSFKETAQRELQEETGLTIPIEEFFLIEHGCYDQKSCFLKTTLCVSMDSHRTFASLTTK